jgi:hypothetical protein
VGLLGNLDGYGGFAAPDRAERDVAQSTPTADLAGQRSRIGK